MSERQSLGRNLIPLGSEPRLHEQLRRHPYDWDFFQAVRVLARLFPERALPGGDADPEQEVVRFRMHLSLSFPPSDIAQLRPGSGDEPAVMTVAFMGLAGHGGPLPRYYTELLLDRVRQRDYALRDFLDLFNHRLVSLFYRGWEKYRFWIGYESAELELRQKSGETARRVYQTDQRPRVDRFSQALLELAGLGAAPLRFRRGTAANERRTSIDDETVRFYVGLLAQQHRPAAGLENILISYFRVPAHVEQFVGQWLQLEPEQQTALSDLQPARLGVDTVVGERFWDRQGRFRLQLGPLTFAQFEDFLPVGSAHRSLGELTRLYAGMELDFDVQLILLAAEVPMCQLDESLASGNRLGWDTWVHSDPFAADARDVTLLVEGNTN